MPAPDKNLVRVVVFGSVLEISGRGVRYADVDVAQAAVTESLEAIVELQDRMDKLIRDALDLQTADDDLDDG